jgi:hypothetical protein
MRKRKVAVIALPIAAAFSACGGAISISDLAEVSSPDATSESSRAVEDSGRSPSTVADGSEDSPCKRVDAGCAHDGECCTGACRESEEGVRRCAGLRGCYLRGETCVVSSQCCGALCVDVDGGRVCAGGCQAAGAQCSLGYDCCSGQCNKGDAGTASCAAGCTQNLYRCRDNAECCSGVCSASDGGAGACLPR